MIDARVAHFLLVVLVFGVLVFVAALLSLWVEMRDELKQPGDDED